MTAFATLSFRIALTVVCGLACSSHSVARQVSQTVSQPNVNAATTSQGQPVQPVVPTSAKPVDAAAIATPAPPLGTPAIDLAILLDTSGSMEGLIQQAKTQLWSIVNDFALAKNKGSRPKLRVALYEYGKQSIPASEHYLRQILPLTDDLDEVSNQLFILTTNGGEEYCARVIDAAARGLQWSRDTNALKIIVIAGNEPFTQGDLDYKTAIPEAVKKGIIVNTIHCGPRQVGVDTMWEDGAILGEGTYNFIDINAAVVHIPAPQDEELARLGADINLTYCGFGLLRAEGAAKQVEQDANAMSAGASVNVARVVTKAGTMYDNSRWDLVDAVKRQNVRIEDLKEEDLSEELKKMTIEQRKEHIEKLAKEREEIQKRIAELSAARDKFIAEKRREMAEDESRTLEGALLPAIRSQAAKKGYEYDKR